MEINIDLNNCEEKEDVLERIGEILKLGGPKGNFHVESEGKEKGWGLNWDALSDSLHELEKGGIWGNSPKLQFPLTIVFLNYGEFKSKNPGEFKILEEIFDDINKYYSSIHMNFQYEFK
jgi:hypothetical protein